MNNPQKQFKGHVSLCTSAKPYYYQRARQRAGGLQHTYYRSVTYRMTLASSAAYFRILFRGRPPLFTSASLRRSMLSARITMAMSPLVKRGDTIHDITDTTVTPGIHGEFSARPFTRTIRSGRCSLRRGVGESEIGGEQAWS